MGSRLMKIPRARQDAHVARMADFLRRIVGVLAAVVVERFDQRAGRRHRMLAARARRWRGASDQCERSVRRCATRCATCSGLLWIWPSTSDQPRAHHLLAERSITFGHTTILAMPVSSSSVMNTTPLALPGRCRTSTTPAQRTRFLSLAWQTSSQVTHALPGEHRAQKFHRMALQRQPDGLVIGDHLLRQRHHGQRRGVFVGLLARGGDFEQRQRHVVRQSAHRPQRRAAVEPERAKSIGIGQQDQRALRQCGVAGKILQRGEGAARARGDDALGPVSISTPASCPRPDRIRLVSFAAKSLSSSLSTHLKPSIWRKPSRTA